MKKNATVSSFIESGLEFRFGPEWEVIRYDEHRFFRKWSGVGRKGVDFLAVSQDELVLLEVKNLTLYPNPHERPDLATGLAGVIGQKVEDTLEGVDAMRQHYQRQWWDPLRRLAARWRLPLSLEEWTFWQKVIILANHRDKLTVVFWIEAGEPADPLYAELDRYLREDLENLTGRVWISNLARPVEIPGWRVKKATEDS